LAGAESRGSRAFGSAGQPLGHQRGDLQQLGLVGRAGRGIGAPDIGRQAGQGAAAGHVRAMALAQVERGEGGQPVGPVRPADLLQPQPQPFHPGRHRRGERPGLGAEVIVERARRHPGRARQPIDADPPEPALTERPAAGIQHAGTGGFGMLGRVAHDKNSGW